MSLPAKPAPLHFWLAAIALTLASFAPLQSEARAVPVEWKAAFQAVDVELRNNLRPPDKWNPFYHAQPSPKYQGIYLWDSAFISLVWKDVDPNMAKDVLRSVLHFQDPNGHIPQMVSFNFGAPEKRKLTNPPVISYAAAEIATSKNDIGFAREVYPRLKAYQAWLWRSRRLQNGLFFWSEPYESGIDNSPRFGNRDESHYINTRNIAAIDLASYVVLDAESLLRLARLQLENTALPSSETQALHTDMARYEKQIAEITKLVRENLWDESSGMFFDRNIKTGKFIRIPTIASFLPLFAGIADSAQWPRLRQHLLNPQEFNTENPLVTVARNSPAFEKDCWRGPIWINTSYMVIKGLERYEDGATARSFAQRTVNMVYKTWANTGKFVEFYDPERYDFKDLMRKKGTGPFGMYGSPNPIDQLEYYIGKVLYLGTKPVDHFVGWTGLVNTMVLEDL